MDGIQIILPVGVDQSRRLFFHFHAGVFNFLQQVCVLNGNRELTSQRFESRQNFIGQNSGIAALHIEHAHHLVCNDQGH